MYLKLRTSALRMPNNKEKTNLPSLCENLQSSNAFSFFFVFIVHILLFIQVLYNGIDTGKEI